MAKRFPPEDPYDSGRPRKGDPKTNLEEPCESDDEHFSSPPEMLNSERATQKTELSKFLDKAVRPLFDLVDSLRGLDIDKDVSLPSIAVVGDQSSGKSSVLEALSGVSLPRGTGIVTRCPLELKLRKARESNWTARIIYGDKKIEFRDPQKISEYVEKAQNMVAGNGVGISKEMIHLEIESPDVCDLTLIDLPGIARVPVKGQPADIADQIKDLIRTFTEKNETIMLVVVACNVDIATTEALQMAQELDPEGNRTLAILTKPDLIDRGTEGNVLDIVHNKVVPLKMGYIIVKCRGQRQIDEGLSIREALEEEENFFRYHAQFSSLISQKKATVTCLAQSLSRNLVRHIKKSLKPLSEQVYQKLREVKQELNDIKGGPPADAKERNYFLIKIISDFNQKIATLIEGKDYTEEGNIFLCLRKNFESFYKHLEDSRTAYNSEIEVVIREYANKYRGRELPGFNDYNILEKAVRRQVEMLEDPAKETLERIEAEVQKRFLAICHASFGNFPSLERTTKNHISDILSTQLETVLMRIKEQFEMEKQIYTQDPIFFQTYEQERNKNENSKEDEGILPEEHDTEKVLKAKQSDEIYRLKTYYKIVRQRLADQLPMMVRHFMLNEAASVLCRDMHHRLMETDSEDYLREESEVGRRRGRLQARIKRLELAQEKLMNYSA